MVDRDTLSRLALEEAVKRELRARNRLLPGRYDYQLLLGQAPEVAAWLGAHLHRRSAGMRGDVVFADKAWRGTRPLTIMSLADRVLYRALVELLIPELPDHVVQRWPMQEFREAPLSASGITHISKTDVASYYEYVDHEMLEDELIAQTGDEFATEALIDLLRSVMGRRLGLPQIHPASDILGDTYIDKARRALQRAGFNVFTYADDFRLASSSLADARRGLAAVASEVRALGLVLSDRKTYTYGRKNYRSSLAEFASAEEALFRTTGSSPEDLTLLRDGYGVEEESEAESERALRLSGRPIQGGIDEDEALDDGDASDGPVELRPGQEAAARAAFTLWLEEDESEDAQSARDAAITQSLLGRALPILGSAGDLGPLGSAEDILRHEPGLTPQLAEYITELAKTGTSSRRAARDALDDLVQTDLLSTWQSMWVAHAAGTLAGTRRRRPHVDWMIHHAERAPDPLGATAAAALGRLNIEGDGSLLRALGRVSPSWQQLVLWAVARTNPQAAVKSVDSELDRLLLASIL